MSFLVISKSVVGLAILAGILFLLIGGVVVGFKEEKEKERKRKLKVEKKRRGW